MVPHYSRCPPSYYYSLVSFTPFVPTCGRMPLPALSLWPGRQPCRPRLVDGRRGGGPSSVAPRSRNPPTERRRGGPSFSSMFSHGHQRRSQDFFWGGPIFRDLRRPTRFGGGGVVAEIFRDRRKPGRFSGGGG